MHNWVAEASFGTAFPDRLRLWKDNCLNKLHCCPRWAFCASATTLLVAKSTQNIQVLHLHYSSPSSLSSLPILGSLGVCRWSQQIPFLLASMEEHLHPRKTLSPSFSLSFKCPREGQSPCASRASSKQTPHRTLAQAPGWTSATGLANCCSLCIKRVILAFTLEHHKRFTLSSE